MHLGDFRVKSARVGAIVSSASFWLLLTSDVLAQSATDSAGKGGTNGALPGAGSTELTYILFLGGVTLFVVGTLKFILSFRK